MNSPILAVNNLSIRFQGSDANVVDDLSFSVGAGRTLCLVGESGCGKSITALALMGLLPTPPAQIVAGTATLDDATDLLSLSQKQLSELRGDQIAMVFQEPMTSLNPAFSIGDQIIETVRRHRAIDYQGARNTALDMLRRVRIPAADTKLDAYPHQLSGGMRQRVMIAMALVNNPKLLLADEPTTALDVTIQAQILKLIRSLQDDTGAALLLITHDLGVVAEVADDVAVIYAGRVVEAGPVSALFNDPQHPYTIGLMSSIPLLARRHNSANGARRRLTTISGSVPPADRFPPGCRFATRCPFADGDCHSQVPPLTAIGGGHTVACVKAPLEITFADARPA